MDVMPNIWLMSFLKSMRITQGQLVRGANLSSETRLSRIINGVVEPRDDEMEKICAFLGVQRKDIFKQSKHQKGDQKP